MNGTTRNLKHPVWDLYDLYRDVRFSVLYYAEKLSKYKLQNSIFEIVLAATTSTSAIAILWLWETQLGQEIWKYILVASALIATIKPVIKLTEKIQKYEKTLTGYRTLYKDLTLIINQVKQSEEYAPVHKNKFVEVSTKEGELAMDSPEIVFNEKIEERCKKQVEIELPSDRFFIPKD